MERLALARTADDFFARVTSCVFLTDCDEEFKKLAIVLSRTDSSGEPFEGMTIVFLNG